MKALKWCGAVVTAGLVLQFIAIFFVPTTLMSVLWSRVTDPALENPSVVNQFSHQGLSTADSDFVVRPSPDLLYSLCLYDLSEGPLEITGQVPSSYWSLQFYGMNTDNFAGVSNTLGSASLSGKPYKVTVIGPGQPADEVSGNVIVSPDSKGLALIRMAVIGQPAEQLQAIQQQARCQSLPVG